MTAKIERLPGTTYTPKVALHRALERVDDTRAVVILTVGEDGSIDLDWSRIDAASFALAAMLIHRAASGIYVENVDDEIHPLYEPPPGP